MNEQLQLLINLQKIDLEIRKEENLIKDITEGIKNAAEELNLKEGILNEERATLATREKELRSKERLLEDINIHLKKCKEKIYQLSNQKEIAALDEEIKKARNEKSKIEEEILILMEEIESLSSALKAKEKELNQEKEKVVSTEKETGTVLNEARSRLESLTKEREGIVGNIEYSLLAEYQRLCRSRGSAVVEMKDDICQGCYMTISSKLINEIKKNDQIIRCENCARILYWNG